MKPVVCLAGQRDYNPEEIKLKARQIIEKDGLNFRGGRVFYSPASTFMRHHASRLNSMGGTGMRGRRFD